MFVDCVPEAVVPTPEVVVVLPPTPEAAEEGEIRFCFAVL